MPRLIKRKNSVSKGARAIKYEAAGSSEKYSGDVRLDRGLESKIQSKNESKNESKTKSKTDSDVEVDGQKARDGTAVDPEDIYQKALIQAEEEAKKRMDKKIAELEEVNTREMNKQKLALASKISDLMEMTKSLELEGKNYISGLEILVAEVTRHALYKLTGDREIYAELIRRVIANVIQDFESKESITFRFSDEDKACFAEDQLQLGEYKYDFEFDKSLAKGGCFIHVQNRVIDASIPKAIDTISSALAKQVPNCVPDD